MIVARGVKKYEKNEGKGSANSTPVTSPQKPAQPMTPTGNLLKQPPPPQTDSPSKRITCFKCYVKLGDIAKLRKTPKGQRTCSVTGKTCRPRKNIIKN